MKIKTCFDRFFPKKDVFKTIFLCIHNRLVDTFVANIVEVDRVVVYLTPHKDR